MGVFSKLLKKIESFFAEKEPPKAVVVTGNKKAVLVGINYTGSDYPLEGCINDVNNQKDILINHFGFDENDIMLLSDDKDEGDSLYPNQENILAAMSWLMDGCKEGDLRFFQYSGHGSQVPDQSGTEADGSNECICPVDSLPPGDFYGKVVIDDKLNDIFYDNLPDGVNCICVYDCCHSGTMEDLQCTRDLDFNAPPVKARYFQPPQEALDQIAEKKANYTASRGISVRDGAEHKLLWVLSGCKDDQTSADATINGKRQGALTWGLSKALRENGYDITYGKLLEETKANLAGQYTQIPQLSTTHEEYYNHKYMGRD